MRNLVCALLSLITLQGCASWSTYNKQRDFIDAAPSVVFIDAKQRAIISTPAPDDPTGRIRRFCAEPSPDALAAIAATGGLNLSAANKGELGYAQGFSEGAASIGLRTQSIQLLRDVMYSNCQAFLNQGVTGFGLETMQRRFQSTLVAVLAIEQLTGVTKANAVALSGQATANDAEVLGAAIKLASETEAAMKSAKTKLETDDAAKTSAKTAFDEYVKAHAGDTTSAEYVAAKDKADKAAKAAAASEIAFKDRSTEFEAAKAVRQAATSAGGAGSVKAQVSADTSARMAAENAAVVSTAVVDIVKNTLELGFGREVCTTLFGQLMSTAEQNTHELANGKELKATCLAYLNEGMVIRNAAVKRYEVETSMIDRSAKMVEDTLALVAARKISQKSADKLIDTLLGKINASKTETTPAGTVLLPVGTLTTTLPVDVFKNMQPLKGKFFIPETAGSETKSLVTPGR